MLIEKNLPQFNNEKALLVVASEHIVKFYLAANGKIEDIDSFELSNPQYTDREGFFESSLFSGSAYEAKKDYTKKKLYHQLIEKMKEAQNKFFFQSFFLFSPDSSVRGICEELPNEFSKILKFILVGNYVSEHPFKLLKRIKAKIVEFSEQGLIAGYEARKLLERK